MTAVLLQHGQFHQLPSGLSLDPSTGEISGTPNAVTPSTVYTVTASNSGGSDSVDITIVVNDVIPSAITYSSNSYVWTNNSVVSTGMPTVSGGPVNYGQFLRPFQMVSPSTQLEQ